MGLTELARGRLGRERPASGAPGVEHPSVDVGENGRARSGTTGPRAASSFRQRARQARRRLGWGVTDQAVSSISNFAVSIFIARELGAVVFGAFTLAYVTYAFVLNASRGLATDPLLVRFSGTDTATWKQAVASCTGTATVVGLILGGCTVLVAAFLGGAARLAFFALGFTLPLLLLQDSWRFALFAMGRGSQALVNDLCWTLGFGLGLVILGIVGVRDVFWYVFAWGMSAGLGAAAGPLQVKVLPRLSEARHWVFHHRDLGPRFFVEGIANSASSQLRSYGISLILGLATLGYVQAANMLMGPFMVVYFGMGLVLLPEAVRLLRRSPVYMVRFCVAAAAGLALVAVGWAIVLWVALPRGLGWVLLHSLWRPAYPLVLPITIQVVGGCLMSGAGIGLHALGSARRSMRAMVIFSVTIVVLSVVGAEFGGAAGTLWGGAAGTWIGILVFWRELGAALCELGVDLRRSLGWPTRELLHWLKRGSERSAEAPEGWRVLTRDAVAALPRPRTALPVVPPSREVEGDTESLG